MGLLGGDNVYLLRLLLDNIEYDYKLIKIFYLFGLRR